jgi:predicted nucleic acid-binding protein
MNRVYLDACLIIYLVETASPFHESAAKLVARFRSQDPKRRIITSRLSRIECRTLPLRNGNCDLLQRYDAFFEQIHLVVADVSHHIIERATDLRARYGFRTPDAIHLATALDEGADVFLTGDEGLARCAEITVEMLRQ